MKLKQSRKKKYDGKKEFIRSIWKSCVMDICMNEHQVNNSGYNKGAICLVNA